MDASTPLVLLHGLGTGPGAWRPQIDLLSRRRHVLAPDLVPLYSRGWPAVVDELPALIGSRRPVDVCGLSLGAQAALQLAVSRPADVRRLVVCAGFVCLPPRLRRRVRTLGRVIRLVPASVVQRQLVAEVDASHRAEARREIAPLRPRRLSILMREVAGVEIDVARIVAPTLVLCGERDEANLPLARVLAAALPQAILKTIPAAGHVANLDAPGEFAAIVASFLDSDRP